MKRILLSFNQLNDSNGVARCAIAIANILADRQNIEVTLCPLYKSEKITEKKLSPKVRLKTVFNFYFPGFAKFLSMFPSKWLYRWIFQKEDFDIEIAFQYGIATYIIGSSKSHNGKKKFAWMHSYDEGVKYRKEYLNMDKVICVSKSNKERLEKELGINNHVDFCYNPINDSLIVKQGQEPINLKSNRTLQFVSVGRLNKVKGYNRLIDCMKKLCDNGYDCSLWIIGPGEEYDVLAAKIKNLGLKEHVILVGEQSNPHKYTAKADVFVCSSYIEGYSTACTEAILLGVPVISTPVSGAKEIIEAAHCGLISKDMNTKALYEVMELLARNPQMVIDWKNILKKTRYAFSQKARVDKLYQILGI